MRLKQKLNETKLSNNKTDEILLKSATQGIFRIIKNSIDNYMGQIEVFQDKKWIKEKKKLAYRTIINNLEKMETII